MPEKGYYDNSVAAKYLFLLLVITVFTFLSSSAIVLAEDEPQSFEIGIGAGAGVLHGLNTEHAIIAPAMNRRIRSMESLWFHLEEDLEIINDYRRTTFVVGGAPMLRLFLKEMGGNIPFVEVGGGVNLISRSRIDNKEIGGSFIFSLMGGVGYEYKTEERPIGISCRFRHLSNGGLYMRNLGINSLYIILYMGL